MALRSLEAWEKVKTDIEVIEINGHIRDVECFSAGINTVLNIINKHLQEVTIDADSEK